MIKILLTTLLAFFSFSFSFAQSNQLSGSVTDQSDKLAIRGATVSLLSSTDSNLIKTTLTDSKGYFEFKNLNAGTYMINISSVGYDPVIYSVLLNTDLKDVGQLLLVKSSKNLSNVTIVAQAPAVTQKEDTSQYSAQQYKVNNDATTEDLIKKMPGITVDRSGTITAQGEQVKKVTVDGKDFFGNDASAAIKNIPAEVVDKIQVFDRLSDQAQLTGIDDGNSQKAINIITKNGIKNSQFGRVFAGYGTDSRYSAGGNVSFFKDDRRVSVVGNFNNINLQNFGAQDLLGILGSAANNKMPGGPAGFRPPGMGPAESFTIAQANGISTTNATGINYGDKWGKKATITASYFFNNSTTDNRSLTNTLLLLQNQLSLQNSDALSKNYNHRFNARLEYRIDSNNVFFVIPSLSFQKNQLDGFAGINSYRNLDDSVYNSTANTSTFKNGYNLNNNFLFRHSFAKKGRSLSFGLNTTLTKNDGNNTINGLYRFYDASGLALIPDSVQQQYSSNLTNGSVIGGNITYTEPLGKKGQLQLEYNPTVQKNKADQQTFLSDGFEYTVFDSTLSNKFNNSIETNNAGITYRYTKGKDEQFAIGTAFQESRLISDRTFPANININQSFFNFLPNGYWRKKISKYSSFRIFYRTSTLLPTINQLQDVYNLSNPLRVTGGNPGLKQSLTQYMGGRFMHTNTKTNRSIFAGLFHQRASDFISNASFIASADTLLQKNITLKKGTQLLKPVNLDGYRTIRTYFTYSTPVKLIKSNINFNLGLVYSKMPGLVNYINTFTTNYQYNAGIVVASNISEYVDFNISYTLNLNDAVTKGIGLTRNRFINHVGAASFRLLNKKGWFIQNEYTYQLFDGLTGGLNQSFNLWNAAVGKKFLKNQTGELKLSVFDLLKQNQNISRNVTNTFIEDSRSNIIQQYFMLTFTYSLKNFGTPKKGSNTEEKNDAYPGIGYPRP